MPSILGTEAPQTLVSQTAEQLLALAEESQRSFFLQRNPRLPLRDIALYLATQAPKTARIDADRALQMGSLAGWLAEIVDDDYCRARSARAIGHPLQLKGKLREALAAYQKALDLFAKLNLESEIGITLSSSLQPLILLGDYNESRLREERARKIFKAQGDELRLARLDANLGNVLHRQDRFEEALVLYRRAEQTLQRLEATDDLAVLLNNLAVCCISLRDFPGALECYRRLKSVSEQRHLQLLTAQADYNIAYLHYLEGQYDHAIDLYRKTRIFCAGVGDPYHAALCDLDQAEICLHLNSYQDSTQLAQNALAQFCGMKMNYEAAKAYTLLGLAACHEDDPAKALDLLGKARELFVLEQNSIWSALVDLYQAVALYRGARWPEALRTVSAAQNVLSHSALKDKAALADLLRSLLHLELGDSTAAGYWGEQVLDRINHSSEISHVRYLCEVVLGRIREGQSDTAGAREYYERAKRSFVNAHCRGEDQLPISQNAATLYRHFISVSLHLPSSIVAHKPSLR